MHWLRRALWLLVLLACFGPEWSPHVLRGMLAFALGLCVINDELYWANR